MTTKNAILLIVKQNNGVEYNSLLNKFSSSYSNVNSARAALSRSLKDLTTFGFLARKNNRFFILAKGEQEIHSEIKNKLIIALNDNIKQKNPVNEIDSIVTRLQVLIQRGTEDKDLLKSSKTSLDFSISDLENLNEKIDSKISHLKYISKVFFEQINSLKELDFNDSFSKTLANSSSTLLVSLFSNVEITVECQNEKTLIVLAARFSTKPKNNAFQLSKNNLKKLFNYIKETKQINLGAIIVYSSNLKVEFSNTQVTVSGPFSEVKKWKK